MPLGHGVQIQRHLFGCVEATGLAAIDRVLLALLSARVVEVRPPAVGHRGVVLLDAGQHLLVEHLLESLGGLHHLGGIGILGAEIGRDVGIVLLTQPEVVVLANVTVERVYLGDLRRDGGLRHRP